MSHAPSSMRSTLPPLVDGGDDSLGTGSTTATGHELEDYQPGRSTKEVGNRRKTEEVDSLSSSDRKIQQLEEQVYASEHFRRVEDELELEYEGGVLPSSGRSPSLVLTRGGDQDVVVRETDADQIDEPLRTRAYRASEELLSRPEENPEQKTEKNSESPKKFPSLLDMLLGRDTAPPTSELDMAQNDAQLHELLQRNEQSGRSRGRLLSTGDHGAAGSVEHFRIGSEQGSVDSSETATAPSKQPSPLKSEPGSPARTARGSLLLHQAAVGGAGGRQQWVVGGGDFLAMDPAMRGLHALVGSSSSSSRAGAGASTLG